MSGEPQVRQGRTVRISYRGEPVAEIRPIAGAAASLGRRLDRLAERGVLIRSPERSGSLKSVRRRSGALQRFLADRDLDARQRAVAEALGFVT